MSETVRRYDAPHEKQELPHCCAVLRRIERRGMDGCVEGMMNIAIEYSASRMRQLGAEYGCDLGAALLLAAKRSGEEHELIGQMTRLVVREIATAVAKLRVDGFPSSLVEAYEQGARDGCRELLVRSMQRNRERTAEGSSRQAA